jgi:hypothetical protein
MALDFQQVQSGLEIAALAKFDATDDTEVVVRGTHHGERYETRVSNVDCEYTTPKSNGTIRIVINLEKEPTDPPS